MTKFDYNEFLITNPISERYGQFTDNEIEIASKWLPDEVLFFLNQEGKTSYYHHFLWTTLPQTLHENLNDWGLSKNNCHAFMRTAFGACIYFSKGKFYYLDPLVGRVVPLYNDTNLLFSIYLRMDAILDFGFYRNYWMDKQAKPSLLFDEIHALTPTLALGGSFEDSSYEAVKMKEHLFFLAQLFGNKAKKI